MPRRGPYFLLLAQKKCKQRKGHPGSPVALLGDSPALLATPGAKFKRASNSRDPLRGYALKHESADCPRRGCATRRLAGTPTASPCEQSGYVSKFLGVFSVTSVVNKIFLTALARKP